MNFLTVFLSVVVASVLIEAVAESAKMIYSADARKDLVDKLIALFISELVCIFGSIDLFSLAGVPLNRFNLVDPYVGFILTGAVLWRGSGYVHELVKKISDLIKPSRRLNV